MEKFDEEWYRKEVKMELSLMGIPLTKANMEEKYHEIYAMWLSEQASEIVYKNDELENILSLFDLFFTISYKYYSIVAQWLENKPIHYKGEILIFEKCFENSSFLKIKNHTFAELEELLNSIKSFDICEKRIDY